MFHNFISQRKLRNQKEREEADLTIQMKRKLNDDDDGIEESIMAIACAAADLSQSSKRERRSQNKHRDKSWCSSNYEI